MTLYYFFKTVHILSAAVLFGTGLGIAFFMLRSLFTTNLQEKYYASRMTVLADYVFTLPAVVLQPLSGIVLIYLTGFKGTESWLVLSYLLYVVAGLCWLPVVWIQIQIKEMCRQALVSQIALPARYYRLFKIWFILGWPAFFSLVLIVYFMVAKPQ